MPDVSTRRRERSGGARPFLKWAGGKRQLLPELRRCYPTAFHRYFEPFLGSGAVFFDLASSGRLAGRTATLSDTNADVIACYEALRSDTDRVLRHLRALARRHAQDGERHYYEIRDGRFNPLRATLREGAARQADTARRSADLAAMLIYLNRTGFNGLFRVNARGEFNVPAGRYTRPTICDTATLTAAAAALAPDRVTLRCDAFERVLAEADAGDFVYLDPPYAPLSTTAHFTRYTAAGFDDGDQRRLRDLVIALARRGCHVLLSNSTAPVICELYERSTAARAAGLVAHRVSARRAINARATRRGPVYEFLITNVAPAR